MKKIPLKNKKGVIINYTIVDDDDFLLYGLMKWHLCRGYARGTIRVDGRQRHISLHKTILKPQKHLEVDHINGDKLDNRRKNLRECTRSQNMINILRPNKSSKFPGVMWNKQKRKWTAYIKFNSKQYHLGVFTDEKEAFDEYEKKYIELYGFPNSHKHKSK